MSPASVQLRLDLESVAHDVALLRRVVRGNG